MSSLLIVMTTGNKFFPTIYDFLKHRRQRSAFRQEMAGFPVIFYHVSLIKLGMFGFC